MERYYQIARCYRDEDFRADRQPEFTQLDIEMSFVDQDDVIELGEAVRRRAVASSSATTIPTPMPRMTYAEAMRRFGSDKPDLRFGSRAGRAAPTYFADTAVPGVRRRDGYVGAVVMPGGAAQTRKELDGWQDWAKARGARGLAYVLVGDDGELARPVAKNLSETERAGLAAARRRERRATRSSSRAGATTRRAGAAGRGAAGDRPPLRADRRGRVGVLLGRRRAAVRAELTGAASGDVAVGAGLDGRTSRVHVARSAEWIDRFEEDPGACARLRLRHRLQRQRDRRRVDPYPPRATCRSGSSTMIGLSEEEAAGEVRLPARRVRLRPAAARRHRVRLGPHLRAARRRSDSIRDVIAFPKTRRRFRPADRCAGADHPRAAQGSRRRLRPRGLRPRA